MNIALITDDFLPSSGGITNVLVNVSKRLNKKGDSVYVLNGKMEKHESLYYNILESKKTIKDLKNQDVEFFLFCLRLLIKLLFTFKNLKLNERIKLAFFYCMYPKKFVNRILSIKNLVNFFKNVKIDVILSGKAAHPLIYSYILSNWFNIPVSVIAHGDDFLIDYPLNVDSIIFQKIDKIIVTNKIMKHLLINIHKVSQEKVKIIHLGVDITESKISKTKKQLREKHHISQESFLILTVSRFYPRKGFQTVIRALNLLKEENPEILIKYYIIGTGEEKSKIEKLVKKLNLKDRVSFLGFVSERLKNEFYKMADLFVLVPEVKKGSIEGFGIVYLEANFFKVPVIGSYSGGVKIAVKDGKTGFLIKPNNEKKLKEKMVFLYQHEKLRKELGELGHKRVLKKFDWDKNAIKYRKLLNKLVE